MSTSKIKVLVVDDTATTRRLLQHILTSASDIEVIGMVTDGQEACDFVREQRPDVVLMDVHMPRLDGFEATRRIMETQPVPIVICTATANSSEVAFSFKMMEAGAVACVEKPVSPEHANYHQVVANLLQTVRLMSEVKVVRRWPRSRVLPTEPRVTGNGVKIIGVGASTGGPPVLQMLLSSLPKDFPVPIVIVQHISRGFLPGLIDWLNQTTGLQVQIASHGSFALAGHVYFAPDDFHLGVGAGGRLQLSRDAPENGLRPAVAHLFRSLAQTYGGQAAGVLLSGMGKDGAAELKTLRDLGAETIAQDRETSIVHGMPGEAIELGAAVHVLPGDRIADSLITLVNRKWTGAGGVAP